MIYPVGIYATFRSGTTYMYKTLKHCNVAVGHMNLGFEGVVLHDFRATINPTRFRQAWHQTRDPLKTVASLAASAQMFWRDEAEHIPGIDPLVDPNAPQYRNAMLYWLWWTERCEPPVTTWRYRIEDVRAGSETWREIVDRLGLGEVIFPNLPTTTNAKPHPPAAWEDLAVADVLMASLIEAKSKTYGY